MNKNKFNLESLKKLKRKFLSLFDENDEIYKNEDENQRDIIYNEDNINSSNKNILTKARLKQLEKMTSSNLEHTLTSNYKRNGKKIYAEKAPMFFDMKAMTEVKNIQNVPLTLAINEINKVNEVKYSNKSFKFSNNKKVNGIFGDKKFTDDKVVMPKMEEVDKKVEETKLDIPNEVKKNEIDERHIVKKGSANEYYENIKQKQENIIKKVIIKENTNQEIEDENYIKYEQLQITPKYKEKIKYVDKEIQEEIQNENKTITNEIKEMQENAKNSIKNLEDTLNQVNKMCIKDEDKYPKLDIVKNEDTTLEDNILDKIKHLDENLKEIKEIKEEKNNIVKFKNKNVLSKDDFKQEEKQEKQEEQEEKQEENIIQQPIINKNTEEVEIREYIYPKIEFLAKNEEIEEDDQIQLMETSKKLVDTLASFNITSEVINISKGPAVTRFEISIEAGVRVSKIQGLSDNIALSLAAQSIRIEAPIPGKSAVGIEVPNSIIKSVYLSEVVDTENFRNFDSKICFGVGKDIAGKVIITDIAKMPHLLIAGATGSGKSVCVNSIISSILYKSSPKEVRFVMIDPKVVELSVYNGIPHLLTPVVTEPEKASAALKWAVSEMEDRYNLFAKFATRGFVGYNQIVKEDEKLPQIVIIIDELADLMMVAAKEVEHCICRLAQLARAAGIHLIVATQRPSVDVITGLIKANIPSRIAFAVSSGTDSRTVLDTVGAEKLVGRGDMLFKSTDPKPRRIQGAFISDNEVSTIVNFIKENNYACYDEAIVQKINTIDSKKNDDSSESDEIIQDVMAFLVNKGKASISMIQRQFRVGYNRAARIIEELEDRGIISENNGGKTRDVLMDKYQFEEYLTRNDSY